MYLIKYSKLMFAICLLLIVVVILTGIFCIITNRLEMSNKICSKISICNMEKKIEKLQFINEKWILEIPKINLKANINFGTSEEVMDKFIGHFDITEVWTGNIGLAAHNRGYPVNYFGRLKELQIGDEIIYTTMYGTRIYKVEKATIIEDTDWSYLGKTKENKITLITCVENEPKYRRCIQAIEFKEEL